VQFTVGIKQRKADHIAVDAEDALIAALKVKAENSEAVSGIAQTGRGTW
jgi:hypothetical protein